MSRAKRSRKTRSTNRRARRYERILGNSAVAFKELQERQRLRKAIEQRDDLPDGVKLAIGFIVDPVGATASYLSKYLEKNPDLAARLIAKEEETP